MSHWRDISLFVALAVLWGLSFPAITVGLETLPPLLFAAFRYDVGAVVLLAYTALRPDGWMPSGRDDIIAVVGGGLFFVAGNGFLFLGQQTVPSSVAAVIQALVPIATALWAVGLLGEHLSLSSVLGVAIGFVGIAFVIRPDPGNLLAGNTLGRMLVVLQVVSVSLGGVLIQRANPDLGRGPMTAWAMLVGAAVLHVGSLGIGEVPSVDALGPVALGAIFYLGVFSTAIAFLIYFTILATHGAFEAALVTYLVPLIATLVGVFVLGETLGVLTLLGFGLVAVGFVLLKRRALRETVNSLSATGGL